MSTTTTTKKTTWSLFTDTKQATLGLVHYLLSLRCYRAAIGHSHMRPLGLQARGWQWRLHQLLGLSILLVDWNSHHAYHQRVEEDLELPWFCAWNCDLQILSSPRQTLYSRASCIDSWVWTLLKKLLLLPSTDWNYPIAQHTPELAAWGCHIHGFRLLCPCI